MTATTPNNSWKLNITSTKRFFLLIWIFAVSCTTVQSVYATEATRTDCKPGKITMFRIQEVDEDYGRSPTTTENGAICAHCNQIDVEIVIKLDTMSTQRAFGFQLRNDKNLYAREAMVDLLRDSFFRNKEVTLCYREKYETLPAPDGSRREVVKDNAIIYRVIVDK